MDAGDFVTRRFRFDGPHREFSTTDEFGANNSATEASRSGNLATGQTQRIEEALKRTRRFLLSVQQNDGHWVAELEGDTILESEYILLLAFLGQERSEIAIQAARYIEQQQLPGGGWAIYPDGPLEISASVKAYWTLKLTGHDPAAEYMVRARDAIRNAGGAELVNSFTRYYFALLGIISYQQCPAVPPELMFLPRWMPFNIYEMSAWSRTIVVPLSLMWALQPVRKLLPEFGIDELFLNSPAELPVTMGVSSQLDDLRKKTRLNWDAIFRQIDKTWKTIERLRIKPFRKPAIRRAFNWIKQRLEQSDGLGAIFPPIIWTVVVLKALGYSDDSPEVKQQLGELERLIIQEGETVRLQPCKSPVWDTAISVMALREAGLPADHRAMRKAAGWLLSKEVRQSGDWSVRTRGIEPTGWFFEYENRYYP
ncbi:MAG: squalene--hopene cyclase, partial [Planctomycetaceae bacterium]|nr:squalene--hopene cyclase [Planctomycetaceae bacterium]